MLHWDAMYYIVPKYLIKQLVFLKVYNDVQVNLFTETAFSNQFNNFYGSGNLRCVLM